MKPNLILILSSFVLLFGCSRNLLESLDNTSVLEDTFTPLGNGLSYRLIDFSSCSSKINLWYDFNSFRDSQIFDNEISVQKSEIWSEVIIDTDSDLKALVRKEADNYNNCIVYYTIKDEIVVQYYINISNVNGLRIIKYTESRSEESFEIKIDENGNIINEISTRGFRDWFRGTRDCIIDAYTNKGGYSIFAAAATVVMDEVAAGIAIVCAAYNIIGKK